MPEEKPRKRRKTRNEIWEEEHRRGTDNDPFKPIRNTVDKGRDGSPTYDEYGFEMDYNECTKWGTTRPRVLSIKATERMNAKYEKEPRDLARMAKLMDDKEDFDKASARGAGDMAKKNAYFEKTRNNLGLKTYYIKVEDVEEWHEKGLRASKDEFDFEKWGKDKKDWYMKMSTGSALRK